MLERGWKQTASSFYLDTEMAGGIRSDGTRLKSSFHLQLLRIALKGPFIQCTISQVSSHSINILIALVVRG